VRSAHRLLAKFTAEPGTERDLVRATWQPSWGADLEAKWQDALYRGFVPDTAAPFVSPSVTNRNIALSPEPAASGIAVVIRPDPTIWDGRFANISWLQELPKPLSKVTWTSVVGVSAALAKQQALQG